VSYGSTYWLAVLAPSGTVALRDVSSGGGPTQNSDSASLSLLPRSWAGGASWANSPASFYASGVTVGPPPPSPSPSPPPLPPPPPVSCMRTLSVGDDVAGALASASPGATVCLSAGVYSGLTLNNIAPSSNVTLAAAPGATVSIGGISMTGDANLTVSGFQFTDQVSVLYSGSNLTFENNRTSNVLDISAYYILGNAGVSISHIQVLNNVMDHLDCVSPCGTGGQGVTFIGLVDHITIEHNTIGPAIANHYTQTGGVNGLVEDYNTFLGPSIRYAHPEVHQNLLQVFGSSSNIEFSDNVARDTGTNGNSVLLETTPPEHATISNVTIHNNLFDHETDGVSYDICPVQGLTFTNNTVVGSVWGTIFHPLDSSTCGMASAGSNYTVTNNVFAETTKAADSSPDGCTTSCTFDYNVTSDGSAVGSHSIGNWTPRWGDTLNYQPVGLPFAAGYDGTGGA
jgi:hypothetical protein